MTSSRLASASAGSTGWRPGVCPCSGRKTCPPGNRPASWCAACTANAVLPIPAIPPIAWMLTIPPAPAAASDSSASAASSSRRPVNEAMSRGSVRVAVATPVEPPRPATTWPRAASSKSARAEPSSLSAPASSRTVSLCGVVTTPRSRSLTCRGLTPEASPSSSCVSPAAVRIWRSTLAKPAGGSATATPLPRSAHVMYEHALSLRRFPRGIRRSPGPSASSTSAGRQQPEDSLAVSRVASSAGSSSWSPHHRAWLTQCTPASSQPAWASDVAAPDDPRKERRCLRVSSQALCGPGPR